MNLFGRTTINPIFFVTGKTAGYFAGISMLLPLININFIRKNTYAYNDQISYILLALASFFIIISLINLGSSTRVGIPSEETKFKKGGLYRISRNPMYIGLHLLTAASIVNTLNVIILALGIYSIIIYHFIILGEEQFLKNRFGSDYEDYMKRVRRYL